jgi:hypothetical protein
MRLALLSTAALSTAIVACAPLAEPAPREASLSRNLLVVTLDDNQSCRGPRPASAGPEGWAGTLQGCSVAYPYAVRMDPKPNPLRRMVEEVFAALTLDDQLAAMAEVEVIGPGGRSYLFTSPPPTGD